MEKNTHSFSEGLPTELLSLIFLFYFENTERDADLALIALTHVSKRWRTAATGYSYLWSRVVIKAKDPYTKVDEWLQRSGDLPLDIVIQPCVPQSINYALDDIQPQAKRWRRLSITEIHDYSRHMEIPRIFCKTSDHSNSPPHLPQLEELEVHGKDAHSKAKRCPSRRRLLFFEAPLLKKLVIDDIRHDWSRFSPSFKQLTFLEVVEKKHDKPFFSDLMKTISHLPTLRDLRLDIKEFQIEYGLNDEDGNPMVLPHLETFELTLRGSCSKLWTWLTSLTALQLRHLKLVHQAYQHGAGYLLWHLQQRAQYQEVFLMNINFPSLEEIHCLVPHSYQCWVYMAKFMKAIPSITHVTLDLHRITYPAILVVHDCGLLSNIKEICIRGHGDLSAKDRSEIRTKIPLTMGIQVHFL